MNYARITLASLLMAAMTALPALAQTLYAGTQLTAVMDTQLSSATANVGDTFSMHVVAPYPNDDDTYAGATVTGQVLKVVRAGRGTKPELQLALNHLILRDGTMSPLYAQITDEGAKQNTRSGAKVALSTLAGMLIGNVIGKTIFHTGGGGIVGAAGGFLYGYNEKSNITVPAGAKLSVTVTRDTVVRRQARPPSY